jgi:signal transduction histidine kinase
LLVADNLITGGHISDRAVQHLQMLASQAAVAMEKAWLYDEQKKRAQELECANHRLAETHEQIVQIEKMSIIGELTSSIAHELRNPLTIIGGFANLMLKNNPGDNIRQYLEIIASETRRTEEVLDHVLDFRKASRAERIVLDLSLLVEQNLNAVSGRMRQNGCECHFSRANDKLLVYGNRDQLSHAIFQFLKLIVDETVPPARLRVRTEKHGQEALISIGIEMSEEQHGRFTAMLKKVCSKNEASQRLTILVAGETLRYHGGGFGLSENDNGAVSLVVELPLYKEI